MSRGEDDKEEVLQHWARKVTTATAEAVAVAAAMEVATVAAMEVATAAMEVATAAMKGSAVAAGVTMGRDRKRLIVRSTALIVLDRGPFPKILFHEVDV